MATKNTVLTKKDFSAIKKLLEKRLGILVKRMEKTHESNKRLLEKNEKLAEEFKILALKIEKISINSEIIYETFLDAMVLIKLHNKKIKDLEKYLELQTGH